ncbi:hypothetical protein K466DRAFT_606306 [Polyporus arcularius HHB13444]|uniref:Uncharacterized protein n=1 Tax=Polyporus arcularius HHB13444 TaxID=1314778 RepID=A0A5C3NS61_9APHY|nr:hypothetical protein K466DRAFT_606306 [Polyporus arcularius HHB13444]
MVFARWVGDGRHATTRTAYSNPIHVYSAAIPPERPLSTGTRIRILATSPAWYAAPDASQDMYDTYDAHIVGRITGVVGWKGRKVVFEVENECAINPVSTIRLRMPYAPEATVMLGPGEVPEGQREAFETDLYTSAVVRARPDDPRCQAGTCSLPWGSLVGDAFLWEPMEDDVGDRHPGDPGGRRKVRVQHVSWTDLVKAAPLLLTSQ